MVLHKISFNILIINPKCVLFSSIKKPLLFLPQKSQTYFPAQRVSNGNTEVLIAELPSINTSVILMYTPSRENFVEAKFAQGIESANRYISTKTRDSPGYHDGRFQQDFRDDKTFSLAGCFVG